MAGESTARSREQSGLYDTLQVIVEGVTQVAGFAAATISIVHSCGDTEVVATAGTQPSLPVVAEPAGAWLVTDLLDADGVRRGALAVQPPDDGPLSEGPRRSLDRYVDQAARAIVSCLHREDLGEQVRLADTARHIVRSASAQLSLQRIIEDSRQAIVEGFGIQGLWLHSFDDGRVYAYSSADESLELADELVQLAESAARIGWAQQRIGLISRGQSLTDIVTGAEREKVLAFLADAGVCSLMFIPLGARNECLGTLVLTRDDTAPDWSAAETDAALDIGHDLGSALLNARTFEQEQRLVGELQRLDRWKSRLIATVSHELKTPLTTIFGHLELLAGQLDDPEVTPSLAAIGRSSERLTRLVEDLLLLSRVDDPDTPLRAVPVALDALVDTVVDGFEVQARAGDVSLTYLRPPEPVLAAGDHAELESLVGNLVANAVRYTPAGGTVTLALRRTATQVLLTCTDNGIGISEDDQQRVFEEFFRSSNRVALALPGTGLGLAISRRIVERHGGRLELTSTLGVGSTFSAWLPAST